jgi:hypothetical protein
MMLFRGWTRADKLLLMEEILQAFEQIEELARIEVADNARMRPATEVAPLIPKTIEEIWRMKARILEGANPFYIREALIKIHKAAMFCLEISHGAAYGRDKFKQMIGQ